MKPRNIPLHTPVKCLWIDSTSSHGWKYPQTDDSIYATEPVLIASIGFVVGWTKAGIAISSSLGVDDKAFFDPLIIPWGCLKYVRPLRRKV